MYIYVYTKHKILDALSLLPNESGTPYIFGALKAHRENIPRTINAPVHHGRVACVQKRKRFRNLQHLHVQNIIRYAAAKNTVAVTMANIQQQQQ